MTNILKKQITLEKVARMSQREFLETREHIDQLREYTDQGFGVLYEGLSITVAELRRLHRKLSRRGAFRKKRRAA